MLIVFEHLPEMDLLTLGTSHKYLAFAVRTFIKVFRKKVVYRKKGIGEHNTPDCITGADFIDISGLPTMLNFLECYRQLISEFVIWDAFDIPKDYYKLPMLDELLYTYYDSSMYKSAIGLFVNNPQVRKITLRFATADLLPALSKIQKLESLELTFFSRRGGSYDQLNFENLKIFKMSGSTESIPLNISFVHLEEFDLNEWNGCIYTDIINLVLQNKKSLKRIRLNIILRENHLLQLTNANLNVTELSFGQYPTVINTNIISNLIKSTKQLKKLVINRVMAAYWSPEYYNKWNNVFDELRSELGNQWNITSATTFNSIVHRGDLEHPLNANDSKLINIY